MFRKSQSREVSADSPRQRRRLPRWGVIAAVVMLLGVGMAGWSVIDAPPAQAGFLGICDPDTTFPAPAELGGTTVGINFSRFTETPVATPGVPNAKGGQAYTVVATGSGQTNTTEQYAGAGLHWTPFAMSCMDVAPQIWTFVANVLFEAVALWPLRILGLLLQFAFSTTIANWLLDAAKTAVTGLSTNVFLTWSPIVIMAVLCIAAVRLARGRTHQGWGTIAWLVGVSIVVTSALTGPGAAFLKNVNDQVGSLTTCAVFATTGAGCADNATSPSAQAANGMVESLAADIWGEGTLGDLAGQKPPSYDFQITHRTDVPTLDDPSTITVPVSAIAAKVANQPTYAEILRWTQTYTESEVAAMTIDGNLKCVRNPDQSPSSFDLTNLDDGTSKWVPLQLCTYKWLVRAALTSELLRDHPEEYATFRGANEEQFTASLSAIGLLPLGLGIGAMGFLVLLYQLELVLLFVSGPVVGLVALKSPAAARKWAEQIAASLVRRIGAGLALGLTIWAAGAVTSTFVNTISGPDGITVVPLRLVPIATSIITIACMIVGFMVLKRLQALLLQGAEIPEHEGIVTGGAKAGGKKVLEVGVSAATGAFAAGSGMRLAGAARGLTRSNALGSLGRAARTGDRAGTQLRNRGGAKGGPKGAAPSTGTTPDTTAPAETVCRPPSMPSAR